ncbi:ChbG/HpnK family deacetylase [Roseateles chitinivorans]|uniref:ChbG/HpnK family deacetylase n=1 Tax=Roseateles chitinivorans TaxID=2917965 RepID=UPI003D66AE31
MNGLRSICLCIDDFGLHEGVNEAALALRKDGRVHALSCMVGAPAWTSGAAALRRDTGGPTDLGLHLDLTQYPLTMPPDSWSSLWMRGTLDRLSPADLRDEIDAQLDLFEQNIGRRPDFIDGHQHVHQFPQVRDALVDVLLRRYPYQKPWLRSTRSASWQLKPMVISRLGNRALTAEADVLAFAHNRRLLGVYDFTGGPERYESLLSRWLHLARQGDLLMCHPSTQSVPGDAIAQARLDEFQVLSDKRFDWHVRSNFVRLEAMSRILDDERFAGARRAM